MKEIFKLNFLPTYGYRSNMAAVVGIVGSILMLLTVSFFNVQVVSVEVLDWFLAFFFSKVNTNAGRTNKLANMANNNVQEIKPPSAMVPLKLESVKVANPRINTTEV